MIKQSGLAYLQKYIIALFLYLPVQVYSQPVLSEAETQSYRAQIRSIVSFLEFILNSVGDAETPAKEKSILINQSYLKIFRDAKVQVEDDLDPTRLNIINKNVIAYLNDLDFFYKDATFTLDIEDISQSINDNYQIFFTVKLRRTLRGTTTQNREIEHISERYAELNLNDDNQEIKIVSLYSNKPNELDRLAAWWNELSPKWKKHFAPSVAFTENTSMDKYLSYNENLKIGDTLLLAKIDTIDINKKDISDVLTSSGEAGFDSALYRTYFDTLIFETPNLYASLSKIIEADSLNISKSELTDLLPLTQFKRLKYLNVSYTGVKDLLPLRNLGNLESLDISHTFVETLAPLRYLSNLTSVRCEYSLIKDLNALQYFERLQHLNCSNTSIIDINPLRTLKKIKELHFQETLIINTEPLASLQSLEVLNISKTVVYDLSPLRKLEKLKVLLCNQTKVANLEPLSGLQSLQKLYINQTSVSDLSPLLKLPQINAIYCDKSLVGEDDVANFLRVKPEVLLIYQSENLQGWWRSLPEGWKAIMKKYAPIAGQPSIEQLQTLVNLEKLDLSNQSEIRDLIPISVFTNLHTLICDGTPISDINPVRSLYNLKHFSGANTAISNIQPLGDLGSLETINLQFTEVEDLRPISTLSYLTHLNISKTQISSIRDLTKLPQLKKLICEETSVGQADVAELLAANPTCKLVYHTDTLQLWWNNLDENWSEVFRQAIGIEREPNPEELHQIELLQSLEVKNRPGLTELGPVFRLWRLEELSFSRTGIRTLNNISQLQKLEKLTCSEGPLEDLTPLTQLIQLRHLDIQNTPVEDLKPLALIPTLKTLLCAGTQVSSIKHLAKLSGLEILNISNTSVSTLKPLFKLTELISLTCYNTKLSPGMVDKFKRSHPACEIAFY